MLHAGTGETHVLGAGVEVGNGGDDFGWMDFWRIYEKGSGGKGATDETPPALLGDALLVGKSESSSALLFWEGKGTAGTSRETSGPSYFSPRDPSP